MIRLSFKQVYFVSFLVACMFIGFTIFIQSWQVLLPCPLLHIERIIMGLLALIFLIIALYNHTILSRKIWSWSACAISLLGALVAGRHVWLQEFSTGEVSLNGFAEQSPQSSFVHYLHQAVNSSLCVQVQWSILGISLAGWTLILFILFAGLCVWQRNRK
ncbi:MAG: disulfide bond formation protein B [Gammaproteobacteria bacterium]